MTEKHEALKPCPFCGDTALLADGVSGQASGFEPIYRVGCSECDCQLEVWHHTKFAAIAAWNNRAGAAQPQPLSAEERRDVVMIRQRSAAWAEIASDEEAAPTGTMLQTVNRLLVIIEKHIPGAKL